MINNRYGEEYIFKVPNCAIELCKKVNIYIVKNITINMGYHIYGEEYIW
jgi:hypothetical protein